MVVLGPWELVLCICTFADQFWSLFDTYAYVSPGSKLAEIFTFDRPWSPDSPCEVSMDLDLYLALIVHIWWLSVTWSVVWSNLLSEHDPNVMKLDRYSLQTLYTLSIQFSWSNLSCLASGDTYAYVSLSVDLMFLTLSLACIMCLDTVWEISYHLKVSWSFVCITLENSAVYCLLSVLTLEVCFNLELELWNVLVYPPWSFGTNPRSFGHTWHIRVCVK